MKFDHDADDLLVLARRGELSDADARRLRDTLAGSEEARFLYEAGRAFDREAPVLAGDDELIASIQRNVEKRLRPSKRRAWAVRLCVAAALITGAAVGAGELQKKPTPEVPATPIPERPMEVQAPAPPIVEPPPPIVEPPPSAEPVVPIVHHRAIAPAPDAGPSAPSAPELFAAANRARMDGDTARAISLSRELEQRFPESREAITTHVSLGLLYLQQGAPSDALTEFRRARAVGDSATLPDAIWGESRALRQLNRVDEERDVLQELLDRYPSSAYASAARRRLTELH